MRTIRYTAAAATVVMSLMNLPFAFDDGGAGMAKPLAWLVTVLGVVGISAAVALLAKAPWGAPAVLAVGVLNLLGAIVALVQDMQGAVIGLAVSLICVVFGTLTLRGSTRAPQAA
jgi:hypothetical protein